MPPRTSSIETAPAARSVLAARPRMRRAASAAVLVLIVSACSAPRTAALDGAALPPRIEPSAQPGPARVEVDAVAPRARPLALPADFATLRPQRFEQELERWTPAGEARSIEPADLARLGAALRSDANAAARAAVILARARDPRGMALLLALLEERRPESDDAASLVAARALASGGGPADAPARLLALARGRAQHPRFGVRAECAASAALLGRDEALAPLLDVLRIGATVPLPAPPPGTAVFESAQRRAASVLAERLGVRVAYAPEAGAEVRAAEVARLAALVTARTAARGAHP